MGGRTQAQELKNVLEAAQQREGRQRIMWGTTKFDGLPVRMLCDDRLHQDQAMRCALLHSDTGRLRSDTVNFGREAENYQGRKETRFYSRDKGSLTAKGLRRN
ncbi:uncharacterized protein UDID_19356 [Ustilago sp. UG-2017a]|nr:uncharacterized protein UDID_19356 [Ustilago sp. UG-2017a]